MKKTINIAIIILLAISSIFILLIYLTPLDIGNKLFRKSLWIISISSVLYILFKMLFLKSYNCLSTIALTSTFLLLIFVVWRTNFKNDWKTLYVPYKHAHFKNHSIIVQYQETGEWSKIRVVEVIKLNRFMDLVYDIDTNNIGMPWIKIKDELDYILDSLKSHNY